MSNDRAALLNRLTVAVLVATLGLAGFYLLVAVGVFEVFPPPTPMKTPEPPTSTSTPEWDEIATWTPTAIPTETPTALPSDTPAPTLTPSSTPTLPPTPTFPPTATTPPTASPTPRATRSARPFTYDVTLKAPQYGGCSWSGVAGEVVDLDGNPLQGYLVHVWGAGIDEVLASGVNQHHNTVYGSQAAWEQFFAPNPKVMEVHVQLHDPYGEDHLPISDEIVIDFPGYCGGALGYVTFTKNH
ncbi:MAG: hypothetical protein PVJ55_04075 [Anaerolineae bacterium]